MNYERDVFFSHDSSHFTSASSVTGNTWSSDECLVSYNKFCTTDIITCLNPAPYSLLSDTCICLLVYKV